MLSQIIDIIAQEWCGSWSGLLDIRPVLLGTENNSRYLEMSRPDDVMLVVGIEARLGALVEQMHVAVPYGALHPLILKLSSGPVGNERTQARKRSRTADWNPSLGELQMRVSARLPALRLNAKAIANLKSGDLVPIPDKTLNQVRLCLQGVPRFDGVLGTCNSHWAIEVGRMLSQEQDSPTASASTILSGGPGPQFRIQSGAKVENGSIGEQIGSASGRPGLQSLPVPLPPALEALLEIQMEMSVELAACEKLTTEVLNIKAGLVVEFDGTTNDPVGLYANGRLVGKGEIVVGPSGLCIRVTEAVG